MHLNHDILLQKLEDYGVRGIISDWFTSYLNFVRKQHMSDQLFPTKKAHIVGFHRDPF